MQALNTVSIMYLMALFSRLPILKCIADDTEWLFFVLFPPPSAWETIHNQIGILPKNNKPVIDDMNKVQQLRLEKHLDKHPSFTNEGIPI